MPVSRRYELLGWAAKSENRYIIEDDYDSELRLSGQPIPTLQSMDVSDKVIYMNTFTKTLASTVRISYMILPRELFQQYYKKLSFYSCTVSNSIRWQNLLKKVILKSTLTGCEIIIIINEIPL